MREEIKTARLLLRRFRESDYDDLFEFLSQLEDDEEEYKRLLRELHIRQSMDGKSRWADNIMIERWFRSLKTELIYINEYRSPKELRAAIRGYIDDYNTLRPHEALDYATPEQVYKASFAAGGAA